MTRKIILRRKPGASLDGLDLKLHPVLHRIYAARSVDSPVQLEYRLELLQPASALRGMAQAVHTIAGAIIRQQRILILGDFDADGATSCALTVRALRAFGARWVDYLVPNRFEYGYGLTPEIVAVAAQRSPDLLITVDNGISSLDGVASARQHGMQVVITDHHLAGSELPDADAIVNPNQPGCEFPSKHLAGVGVAFYVMLALRTHLREQGWFASAGVPEPNLAQWLDLVALGTVADVVSLDHNNRILVEQGLRRIRAGHCCAGIDAILEVAGRARPGLAAADLGFAVAPRLNAAGRLEDMSLGIECLLTDDADKARVMAAQLDRLNQERKDIEQQMREQAVAEIERLNLDEDNATLPHGLCLFDEGWHQGVIGILASRMKDRLHRPVIVFAPAGNGKDIKGSARSVPGVHIRDALDAIAARHPQLISRFGGHAMAAGLTLEAEKFDVFRRAFDEEVRRHLSEAELHGTLYSDGELGGADLDLELAEALRAAGPWGQGFPEPLFDGRFEVVSSRVVGEKHLKLLVRGAQGGPCIDAIAFNAVEQFGSNVAKALHLAYRLDVNEFRGTRSAQLIVEHIEDVGDPPRGT